MDYQATQDEQHLLFAAASAWLSYAQRVSDTATRAGLDVLPTVEELASVSAVPSQTTALADFALQRLQEDIEQCHVPVFWARIAECARALTQSDSGASLATASSLPSVATVDKVGKLLHHALKELHGAVSQHCIQLSQLSSMLLSTQQPPSPQPIPLYLTPLQQTRPHSLPPLADPLMSSHGGECDTLTSPPQGEVSHGGISLSLHAQNTSNAAQHHTQNNTATQSLVCGSNAPESQSGAFSFPSLPPPSMQGPQLLHPQNAPIDLQPLSTFTSSGSPPSTPSHAKPRLPEPATPDVFHHQGHNQQQHHHHQQQQQQQHEQQRLEEQGQPQQHSQHPRTQGSHQQHHLCASPDWAAAPASVSMCFTAQLPKLFEVRVSALLLASATSSLTGALLQYFSARLLQLGDQKTELEQQNEEMRGQEYGLRGTFPNVNVDTYTPSPARIRGLCVNTGNGGNDAMECDDADGSIPGSLLALQEQAVLSGGRGGYGTSAGNGCSWERPASVLGTPASPPPMAPSSCLVGRGWEGEVADVSALMAGLGAHAACEEAAAAAVAADMHRRLSGLAKGVYDTEVAPQALHYMRCVPATFLRLVLAGASATGSAAAAAMARARSQNAAGGANAQPPPQAGPREGSSQTSMLTAPHAQLPSHDLKACLARADKDVRMERAIQEWHLRLMYMTYESLGMMRISEMFEIVVDYPDSHPAVLDLAACLRNTNLHSRFVSSFRVSLCNRLLHAGAHARDIVHQYVATIRVLREIDPSGALLAAVAGPLRRYLRQRPDTARCVVTLVTKGDGEGSPSLLEELQQGAASMGASGGVDKEEAAATGDDAALLVMHKAAAAQTAAAAAMVPATSTADWWLQRVGSGDTPGGGTPASNRTAVRTFHQGTPPPHSATSTPHTATPHTPGTLPTPGSAAGLQRVMSPVPGSYQYQQHSQRLRQQQPQQQECVWWDAEGGWDMGHGGGGGEGGVDIVALLIGIFGSKDVFVSEYRLRLARELLALSDYDTTAHLRIMELLKLRFGDAPLHACEVMLKDMSDSKRVNTNILHATSQQKAQEVQQGGGLDQPQQQQISDVPLSATIISHLFWPPIGGWGDEQSGPSSERAIESGLNVPSPIAKAMESYAQRYTALKAPRKLHWKPHVGCVEMQVAVGDVAVEFCVSPVLATILAPFQQREALTAEQLAAEVGLPVPLVRRRALFWVNHGILLLNTSSSTATERQAPGAGAAAALLLQPGVYRRAHALRPAMYGSRVVELGLEEDAPTQLPTAIDSLVLELGPYEPYIMGMLTNYGGLPLDRLHTMLKLFVVSPKYDKSTEQLASFLSHLASQEKLMVDNGVWKKKPPPSKPSEN